MNQKILMIVMMLAVFLIGISVAEESADLIRLQLSDGSKTYFVDALDNSTELAEDYIRRILPNRTQGMLQARSAQGEKLSGTAAVLYSLLYADITDIADGVRSSTAMTYEASGVYEHTQFMAADLGVLSILDENGEFCQETIDAIHAVIAIDMDAVIQALLLDCPYELYWYDKTAGITVTYPSQISTDGETVTISGDVTVQMRVSADYALNDEEYQCDTSYGQNARAAAATARAIVDRFAGSSDREKLVGYANEICDLTSYNDAAADGGISYGNPWQLVWVFDGDADTNVVCEGYAKAFQYLCDLTTFTDDISVITVTGTMTGGTGAGAHMWNIVKLSDGLNYLVDITNIDENTVGYPDTLLLAGASEKLENGYVILADEQEIQYVYDSQTIAAYSSQELTLTLTSFVAEGLYMDQITWTVSGDGVLTISGTGAIPDPDEIKYQEDGTVIDFPWKLYADSIASIVVEEGITAIANLSFTFMPNVRTICLPASVIAGDNHAFDGSYMDIIVSPRNPVFLSKDGMLLDKEGKTLISWPSAKGDVRIPDGIEVIAASAFNHVFGYFAPDMYPSEHDITSVVFPKSVALVNNTAFGHRRYIRSIGFENDHTKIGPCAFSYCTSLTNVKLPANLEVLDTGVFQSCAFAEIEIPASVRLIDSDAFNRCSNLTSIVIPEGVVEIGDCAFVYCTNLSDVKIPSGLKQFGYYSFLGTPFQEKRIANDMLIINNVLVAYTGTSETFIVPEGITDVCGAFYENSSIRTLVLPKSLTHVYHPHAFASGKDDQGHYILTKIIFASDAPVEGNDRFAGWTASFFYYHDRLVVYYPENAEGWDQKYWDDRYYLGTPRTVKDFHVPYCCLDDRYAPVLEHRFSPVELDQENNSIIRHCTACGYLQTFGSGDIQKLPLSIARLEDRAFAEIAIKVLEIPEGLTDIHEDAFYGSKVRVLVGYTDYVREYAKKHHMHFIDAKDIYQVE